MNRNSCWFSYRNTSQIIKTGIIANAPYPKKKNQETRKNGKNRQKKITYADLEVSCSLAVRTLLSFRITEKPGEHAKGIFRLRLDPDESKDKKSAEPFLLWNKNADGKKEPLFGGYPDSITIILDGGCREAEVTVLSGSSLLDEEKRDRAFQTPGQGILSATDRIVKDTAHAAYRCRD